MKANNGTRYCKQCGGKLLKNGQTSSGAQRWRCSKCGKSCTINRPDTRARNLARSQSNLLSHKGTISESAVERHISRRTASRRMAEYLATEPVPPPITGQVYDYIVIDATWLEQGGAVAIAKAGNYVCQWEFGKGENMQLWLRLLAKIPKPGAIVCDGQKGMLEAIRRTYGKDIPIQRCHFHIKQNLRLGLPVTSREPAVLALRELARQMRDVHTMEDVKLFNDKFMVISLLYDDYVNEYTVQGARRKDTKIYTRHKLHTVYQQMSELIAGDNIFTFISHPELHLPKTTNALEGGINSRISELLLAHRGLTKSGQQHLINDFLWSKTEFGRTLIYDEETKREQQALIAKCVEEAKTRFYQRPQQTGRPDWSD